MQRAEIAPVPRTGNGRGAGWFDPDRYAQFASLPEAYYFVTKAHPELLAYEQAVIGPHDADPTQQRSWIAVTRQASQQRVLAVAECLERWGAGPGDTIAILALERPEWIEAEMAVYTVGARLVAPYVRDSDARLGHILGDARARFAIVENRQQWERISRWIGSDAESPHGTSGGRLRGVIVMESMDLPQATIPVVRWAELATTRSPASFAWTQLTRDAVAALYYTSGSTGMPKGVVVTHGQILQNLWQIGHSGLVDFTSAHRPGTTTQQPVATCILPEHAHAYPARTAHLLATSPAVARYPAIVDRDRSEITPAYRASIQRDLRERGGGVILVVPKILLLMQLGIEQRLAQAGWYGRLVSMLIRQSAQAMLAELEGHPAGFARFLDGLLRPLRRLLTAPIRQRLVGPDFIMFISGGAKLPLPVMAYLLALDLPAWEGYGTTETNCPIAVNLPPTSDAAGIRQARRHWGSVGRPFRNIEVKIDPGSGELWIRGPNLASGYWEQPQATQRAWSDDGWYRTGDLAHLDPDGYLYIDARIDDMLVPLNGENVSATNIEARFASIPYVESVVVIGHQRPYLVALVSLKPAAIQEWAARQGISLQPNWHEDPAIRAWFSEQMEIHVNRGARHPAERIRRFAIVNPPNLQDQTLTVTEKLQRTQIERHYRAVLESLYEPQSSSG